MTTKEHDLLILRYLDGTASAEEVTILSELLQSDEQARAFMRATAEQAVVLADFAREQTFKPTQLSYETPHLRWQRRLWSGSLAALCLVLVLGGTVVWVASKERPIATVAHASGAVSFTPNGGDIRTVQKADERMPAGIIRVEGAASSVEFSFQDGSSVTLMGDAELAISDGKQKVLTLNEGLLSANVRPQRPGRPMIIHTPTADVEVVGTQFSMTAEKVQTKLMVETGSVKFCRRADGQIVDVAQGTEAVANLDTAGKIKQQIEELPNRFHQTFDIQADANSWRGKWLPPDTNTPGRIQCTPDLSYRKADGTPVVAYTVSMFKRPESIVDVVPESELRLRLRTAKPHYVMALVGLRHPNGSWAANFLAMIQSKDGDQDGSGWRTVRIPLSAMKGTLPSVPAKARVFLIHLAAYFPDSELEVAEVSIVPPNELAK